MAKKAAVPSLDILAVERGELEVCILGTSPLICNRMGIQSQRDLLMPKGRKTALEKSMHQKHSPLDEYQASVYRMREGAPTEIGILTTAFKKAMASAALDNPGARKTQIGRLVRVQEQYVPIYGLPVMMMCGVRMPTINNPPDIRTRAVVPEWACRLVIDFVKPIVTSQAVANLLAAAGMYIGVGDWRGEKGSGNYGAFEICAPTNEQFAALMKTTRRAQVAALEEPRFFDPETADIYAWFTEELERRRLAGKVA